VEKFTTPTLSEHTTRIRTRLESVFFPTFYTITVLRSTLLTRCRLQSLYFCPGSIATTALVQLFFGDSVGIRRPLSVPEVVSPVTRPALGRETPLTGSHCPRFHRRVSLCVRFFQPPLINHLCFMLRFPSTSLLRSSVDKRSGRGFDAYRPFFRLVPFSIPHLFPPSFPRGSFFERFFSFAPFGATRQLTLLFTLICLLITSRLLDVKEGERLPCEHILPRTPFPFSSSVFLDPAQPFHDLLAQSHLRHRSHFHIDWPTVSRPPSTTPFRPALLMATLGSSPRPYYPTHLYNPFLSPPTITLP